MKKKNEGVWKIFPQDNRLNCKTRDQIYNLMFEYQKLNTN